ncbi:MAG: hypothetical protein M0C28_21250 [Candidatus Moduliflexus flocculans]|nr:hypothetical protein [Candidatus Moduliflexus flocculans]
MKFEQPEEFSCVSRCVYHLGQGYVGAAQPSVFSELVAASIAYPVTLYLAFGVGLPGATSLMWTGIPHALFIAPGSHFHDRPPVPLSMKVREGVCSAARCGAAIEEYRVTPITVVLEDRHRQDHVRPFPAGLSRGLPWRSSSFCVLRSDFPLAIFWFYLLFIALGYLMIFPPCRHHLRHHYRKAGKYRQGPGCGYCPPDLHGVRNFLPLASYPETALFLWSGPYPRQPFSRAQWLALLRGFIDGQPSPHSRW